MKLLKKLSIIINMCKFKIGDKVKVLKVSENWLSSFEFYGGKFGNIYTVTNIYKYSDYQIFILDNNRFSVNFKEDWLELVDDKKEKEQVKDNGINFLLTFKTRKGGIEIFELQSLKKVREKVLELSGDFVKIEDFKLYQVQKERKISSNLQIKISK